MTSPVSFKIDSPSPAMAAEDAEKYLAFMAPSLRFGGVEYELEDFRAMVADGEWLLIRVWDDEELISVSAVQIRELADGRDLYIVATGSKRNINEWIDAFDRVLVQLAAEAKASTITVLTRNGMGKIAKRAGYRVHQVVIRKRVRKWAVH